MVIDSTNKVDTDDKSRGHVKGDNGSDLKPLGMKDIDDHDVFGWQSERVWTDNRPQWFVLFIWSNSLKEENLDQVNQSEPAILTLELLFFSRISRLLFVQNHQDGFRGLQT